MPFVTTPTGDTFEETNPVALNYYRREPGYTVSDIDQPERRPGASAPKPEWLAYARTQGFDGDDDSITKADLIAEYGAE